MLETIFYVLIGSFIGWHFPQPLWAKMIEEKIKLLLAKK